MDVRQLNYFLAIAKEEQITRAAQVLHMEQPPLSRQLKLMEEELGVTLFDRNGKQMKLTQAGEVLQRRAESLLHDLNEAVKEVKDIENGLQGTLSIGSGFSCISLLPLKIGDFNQKHPRVTFKILEGDHSTLTQYLEHRNVELVLTRLPFETKYDSDKYIIKRLPSDPFVAVVPRQWNCFTLGHSISLKQLADIPFLALKSDKTIMIHERIANECRRFGFELNITCECPSVAIIIALVVAGIGATILPKSVMTSFQIPDIQILDIYDTSFQSEVGIVWLQNRYLSKSAQTFIDIFDSE